MGPCVNTRVEDKQYTGIPHSSNSTGKMKRDVSRVMAMMARLMCTRR